MALEIVSLLETLTPVGLSAIGGFAGTWLAARFALTRFYRERTWDRRADAYTAVFEALHDMDKWFEEHIDSEERGRELPADKVAKLTEEYQQAGAELKRRLAKETWLISDQFRARLATLEKALSQRITYWPDFLNTNSGALRSAFDDLRRIARADLSIRNKWQ